MTFIQYADLNRSKLIVCTSKGALQGAAPPTFPLLDSVLSLLQLLIRYLGRGLDIKINAHISEVRASILIRKCSTAGTVSSPRLPLPDRTTRGCTGGWGLPPRRCGILDQWPAFWTAGPALDLLLLQQKTVLLCGNAQSAASLKQSSEEEKGTVAMLGSTAGNVRIYFLVYEARWLTLNASCIKGPVNIFHYSINNKSWCWITVNWSAIQSIFLKYLTFQLVMLWVRRKSPVGEKLREADSRILWLVHHVVPNSLHQSVHKFQAGCAQNLNDLIPLVDVWRAR